MDGRWVNVVVCPTKKRRVKMLTENQQKWVEALRSGKFKQGIGQLEQVDDEGNSFYCCLGVACVIAEENGVEVETFDGHLEGQDLSSHPAVMEWLELSQESGLYQKDNTDTDYYLTEDNDGANSTRGLVLPKNFEQIADIIESEPRGLFKND
jgi:hypothetical protein